MTYIHRDRINDSVGDRGYSIRVGQKVPENSANLAYVSTPEISPADNLSIADESINIPENQKEYQAEQEKLMFPDEDFRLRELSGASTIESSEVLITDEFSVPTSQQDTPLPLYYKGTAEGLFDAEGALVSPYYGGYMDGPPERRVDYSQISGPEKENLLYSGEKISIVHSDGTPLTSDERYKIHLVATEGDGIPENAYRIEVYTNFRNSNETTYLIRYERYEMNGGHTLDHAEVLNVTRFFRETDEAILDEMARHPKDSAGWREELNLKEYALIERPDDTYEIKAPAQVITADQTTRPAHQFEYRLKAHLTAKLSDRNPGTLNVGIAYLNQSIINVENLSGMLKRLNEDGMKPGYLNFQNPYPPQRSFLKDNTQYWVADLDMPMAEWLDYDLIILTGYGYQNMDRFNDNMRAFLEHGGTIWVDNAGAGSEVLSFANNNQETFISTIGFSKTTEHPGFKTGQNHDQPALSRLYDMNDDTHNIGYDNGRVRINPAITFGSSESSASWRTIIRYSNNNPSVIERTMYQKGRMIVSNCGIFRGLPLEGREDNTRLFMNIALDIAERKWIHGPWLSAAVFHRNNLFRKEYTDPNGKRSYLDAQNDYDPSQIVAKKLLAETTRHGILPYLPVSHYSAEGVYEVEVSSDQNIPLDNNSFENGRYDSTQNRPVTEWDSNTNDAIPGWNLRHPAGATPSFAHEADETIRGHRSVSVGTSISTGTHAYWAQETRNLVGGRYRTKVWLKTQGVAGVSTGGAKVGVFTLGGEEIASSIPLTGTRNWTEVPIDFNLDRAQPVEIRIGFVDGNATGRVYIDQVTLDGLGSVYMTPSNDGTQPLTAWAVNPRGETFDLRAQGFSNADVTVYDPAVEANILIRSFVYAWDNATARYMRMYGNMVIERRRIRRSDGVVDYGPLSTLIPALNGGSHWADRNDVYYEISVGDPGIIDLDSDFVNLQIYDISSGTHYYSKAGGMIIRYTDLFYFGENRNVRLQARTDHYTIRATKRRYGVKVRPESGIHPVLPSTLDNREGWYVRILNGAFKKDKLTYNDLKTLSTDKDRYETIQNRVFGTHHYRLPEYRRQLFSGGIGLQDKHEEIAEYIDDRTLKVQNAPLHVDAGTVNNELMRKYDNSGTVYQGLHRKWDHTKPIRVFVDEDMNGVEVEWLHGFDIDHENGAILFEEPVNGVVKASYSYNNLSVWKRTYAHEKIRNEVLSSTDRRTFASRHRNWLKFPTPIIKATSYYQSDEKVIPVNAYTIDYSAGVVTFKEDVVDRVIVDYSYSKDEALKVADFDAENGFIHFDKDIDFREEMYVNYTYEENYLEYRGYYDETLEQFIHLDLNPSEGHYVTLPETIELEDGRSITSWEMKPSRALMNKEVYLYITPYRNSFGEYNENTVRHCFTKDEWTAIQKTNPAALLLGIIQVREHATVHDAIVMDARQRGGGLRADIGRNEMERRQPESMSYWDMDAWDGTAYSKNGVLVIRVPEAVLESKGGRFKESEVEEMVKRHVAYGIYPIVEYV